MAECGSASGELQFSQTDLYFPEGASALSGGLGIVLIIIVWLFVLAPWLLRSQRPVSHTGEAFDDTRVLHKGGTGDVEGRRRPKLTAHDVHSHADVEDDYELVEAIEDDRPQQTISGAAARAKAAMESERGNRFFAFSSARKDDELDDASDSDLVDGEVVDDTPAEAAQSYRDSRELPVDAELVEDVEDLDVIDEIDAVEPETTQVRNKRVYLRDRFDEDVLDENLLDDSPAAKTQGVKAEESDAAAAKQRSAEELESHREDADVNDVAAAQVEIFTAPAVAEVSDDAYDLDETYVSPVDLMYPGAVDPQPVSAVDPQAVAKSAADSQKDSQSDDAQGNELGAEIDADALEAHDVDDELDTDAPAGEESAAAKSTDKGEAALTAAESDLDSDELSEEELEFAARRMGRGGWDPVADKQASASRFQRRQRTLIALAVVVVLTVALGIVVGGWTWLLALAAGAVTTMYLVALRTQVRQEHALRARRIRQLRRARLGVRNASDEELAIPRNLRRPGAVVLEADDDSPDFDHLPVHFDSDDVYDPREPQRRRGRDDLAARRVG